MIEDLKKRVAELAAQNTQLSDHLANMCTQADEDCLAEVGCTDHLVRVRDSRRKTYMENQDRDL